jgi:UDP-N-acetyl-2-amino-2-deoxyglucuronate dehydrogenase
MKNFAMTGLAGFVAPRHLRAIRDTGNRLTAALDPHDSVGILDQYFPDTLFFTQPERFERFLEKSRHQPGNERIHYLSICSPNYLHDAHIRMALRAGANAICEKPLVINPWNMDMLQELEAETGNRVYTVLQLRLHPTLIALKERLASEHHRKRAEVSLTYVTRRGKWYGTSWKASSEKSGGLAMNIGVHFFDLLIWLFGSVEKSTVELNSDARMCGELELEQAHVRWLLSIDVNDLPESYRQSERFALRSITIDGQEVEFSDGFTDLHTRVYETVLNGQGFGIEEARPSIELVYAIRTNQSWPPQYDQG